MSSRSLDPTLRRLLPLTAAAALTLLTARSARAQANECLVAFEGAPANGGTVTCDDSNQACDADGVSTANGSCVFRISVCANVPDPACTPAELKKLKVSIKNGKAIGSGGDNPNPGCSAFVNYEVKLKKKGKKPGTAKLIAKAIAAGKPKRKDKDLVKLVCNPSTGDGGDGGPRCVPSNTGANEPNEIILNVKPSGTDLDNGWKGPSFNFPTPENTKVQFCLSDCDSTSDPDCTTKTPIGANTFNENYFGSPLPLFAAGVPVCVLNEYRPEQATELGTANLQTGTISGAIRLNSRVFITEEENVCPKCNGGTCNSGPNQGKSCQVDGTVTVSESSAANKTFDLSKDCPPNQGTPAGVLVIDLPLTTGTSTLAPQPNGGTPATPCVQQPGQQRGVTPAANLCGAGSCSAGCTGTACANPNGVDPVTGATVCIDAKGGISQFCCSTDTTRPCHPTAEGTPISRTGSASVPQPPWPDPTYPKTSDIVNVATFCEAATGTGSVDGLTGLPGPGALVLPNTASWKTPQSP